MGKLRATSDEERQSKRRRILNSAGRLFEDWPFRDISMHRIAEAAGLAKGTVYLYFGTKEELFLAFFDLRAEKWTENFLEHMEQRHGLTSPDEIGSLVASTVTAQPSLIRLFALRHRCLNGDLGPETASSHLSEHNRRSSRIVSVLASRIDVSNEEIRIWLRRVEAVIAGLAQQSTHPGASMPGEEIRPVDFESELRHISTVLLEHAINRRTTG